MRAVIGAIQSFGSFVRQSLAPSTETLLIMLAAANLVGGGYFLLIHFLSGNLLVLSLMLIHFSLGFLWYAAAKGL